MTEQHALFYDPATQELICRGDWDISQLLHLESLLEKIKWPQANKLIINGQEISKMDSAGAWLLLNWAKKLKQQNIEVTFVKFSQEHESLLSIIRDKIQHESTEPPTIKQLSWLGRLGKTAIQHLNEFLDYLNFIGKLSIEVLRISKTPHHLRFKPFMSAIYKNGYQALGIIALLSFMIGVVIAYQMGIQLRNYGANIYVVDFLGLSVLREFGPLLTAIMVAGRTGSSFTAQLGIMKINQEIDALDTMGVTPAELLILPRIAALLVALPLLTIWSDVFGIIGGMVMANNMLNITMTDFLDRFPQVIPLRTLLIGMGKTPVFALIIATIGCFEGMKVQGSADSVGRNTTKSVVLAIFFIIVADAFFSIIFSELKL